MAFVQYVSILTVPGARLTEMVPMLVRLPNWIEPWKRKVKEMGNSEAEFNIGLVKVFKFDVRNRKRNGTVEGKPE